MIKRHKIPTIFALVILIILIVGLVAAVLLVQVNQSFNLSASPGQTPENVQITNIFDNSLTVSWTTSQKTLGFVAYGKNTSLGLSVSAGSTPSSTHNVTLVGLSPETVYFFKIGSGKNLFDNSGKAYQIQTGAALSLPKESNIIFGAVKDSSGGVSAGSLVYISLSGASPLSSITDVSGRWSVNLSSARSLDLSNYALYDQKSTLNISVVSESGQVAGATASVGASQPVPDIILGQNSDFTKNSESIPSSESKELPSSTLQVPEAPASSSKFSLEPLTGQSTTVQASVTLDNPQSLETVNTQKPQFSGKGTPGTKFSITVHSAVSYSDTVTVGQNGSWFWSPPENLIPGNHTVSLAYQDSTGQTKTITRSFVVAAGGDTSLPAFVATPSASATEGISPTSLTVTPSTTPSATPSSAVRIAYPSTSGGMPVSGDLTPTIGAFIMGLVLLILGLFLPKFIKT